MKDGSKVMDRDRVCEILRSLRKEIRREYKAELKGIFGSYARNEAQERSDVDVLVEFLDGATLFDLTGLGDFLEEKLQRKVDIVSLRAVREEIKESVYEDMVLL